MLQNANLETETQLTLLEGGLEANEPVSPVNPLSEQQTSTIDRYFWTTKEIVRLLNLPSPEPLYQARSEGKNFRQGALMICPSGRNRWEAFRLECPGRENSNSHFN